MVEPELGVHTWDLGRGLAVADGPPGVVRGPSATLFSLDAEAGEPCILIEEYLEDEEIAYVRAVWGDAQAGCPEGAEPQLDVSRRGGDLVVSVEYATMVTVEAKRQWAARPAMGQRRRRARAVRGR